EVEGGGGSKRRGGEDLAPVVFGLEKMEGFGFRCLVEELLMGEGKEGRKGVWRCRSPVDSGAGVGDGRDSSEKTKKKRRR
ncbi:hypothetical protein HAX54_052528, partial [Datura stramonium]|nr:hypothetical protein [Datura stramonium]